MGDIIDALTKPLTAEEKSPRPKEVEKQYGIAFKGSLKEVSRFFYRRGWTDGFPIVPPTAAEVAEMLTGTDLPPEHVVAKIIPRLGKATVEKIAVNAVMAGALPTYLPVLIAGVQALMDPLAMFGTTEVSTASWVPFWIINGPLRHDLHINSGTGALSPGNIANSTIGRAMGLIIKNIGGARPGVEDMGTYGNSGKYTMVTAESEEESPWEPLHVEQGINRGDSAVTLSFPTAFLTAGSGFGSDAKGVLRSILSIYRGEKMTIMLNAQHARALADDGWPKKEIAAFIAEYMTQPASRLETGFKMREKTYEPLNLGDFVGSQAKPGKIRLLVAGGPGGLMMRLITGGTNWVTKKIELPQNWDKLVEKYKDLVPTYVRY